MSPLRPSTVPVAKTVVSRIDKAIRWRVDEQIGPRVAEIHHRLAALERRLDVFGERLDKIGHDNFWTAEDIRRVAPQVAALDARLEDLRQSSQPVTGSPQELDEARNILDEVRREHERVRVRLTAVAWYEDRLRKLEDQLSSQAPRPDGIRDSEPVAPGVADNQAPRR